MLGSVEKSLPLFRDVERKARSQAVASVSERGRSASSALGLSKGHISPHLSFHPHAGLLKLSLPYEKTPDWRGAEEREADEPEKRGKITGFSPESQRRLRQYLAKIPDSEMMRGRLITLTWPSDFPAPEDTEAFKRPLDSFRKSLARRGGSGVWVLEFQKRGAPHYHLIIFGLNHIPINQLRELVAKRWYEIVGSGDPKHLKAGTAVEYPKSSGKARGYLAKYCSKGDQALEGVEVGRYWGKISKKSIPIAPEVQVSLTLPQSKIVQRLFRRAIAKRVYESAWGRLHRKCTIKSSILKSLSTEEFKQACQFYRSNRHSPGESISFRNLHLSSFAIHFALHQAFNGSPVKFPHRWRSRNNSSMFLFADSDSFTASLKKHPELKGVFDQPISHQQDVQSMTDCHSDGGAGSETLPPRELRCYKVNVPFPLAKPLPKS